MPWIAPLIGAVAGPVLGGLFGSSSGSSGGYAGPPAYVPTGLGTADTQWQALQNLQSGQAQGINTQVSPYLQNAFTQQAGMNYAPLYQAGQQQGQQYQGLSNQAGQYGQYMQGQAAQEGQQQQNLYNTGQNIMNMASDPQQALYNRTLQQVQDQTNAQQAMRGLGTSPQGAQEMGNTLNNFNIDWQNNLLNRSTQGAQAMNALNQTGIKQGQLQGADLTAAQGYSAMQPGYTGQAAQAPISGQQAMYQGPATAAQQYAQNLQGSVMAPESGVQNQAIPYMNYGVGAQGTLANQALASNQMAAQNTQGLSSAISQAVNAGGSNSLANQAGSWLNNMWGTNSTGYNTGTGGAGWGTIGGDWGTIGGD